MKKILLLVLMAVVLLPATLAVVDPTNFVEISTISTEIQTTFSINSQDTITHDRAYYSINGEQWQQITLSGNNLDSNWIQGTTTGSMSQRRALQDRNIYVIIFTCSLTNNAWDCHGNDWQLLQSTIPASDDSNPPTVNGNAWSNPQTWTDIGQSTPQAGDVVTIPSGESVVLDVTPPALNGIMVHGTLEFADTELELSTDYIKVMGSGAELIIGTEDNPYTGNVLITLTGTANEIYAAEGDEDNHCGTKVICSMGGGRLEMISDYTGPSWTRLADGNTAEVGDTSITLEENVNWQVGDEIVIVSTDFDPGQAEKRTINTVNGNKVTFSEPLKFEHYGEKYCKEGYCVDMRAEVMHLTRNIKIQGDADSANTQLGGHIMTMNEHHMIQENLRKNQGREYVDLWQEFDNDLSLVPKIEGVELYRMGQQGILARYPWHWHLYGDASGSYVKNTAVHDSFQRCYTIHGTQNVLLENNVAYNAVGHCYFLEDAAEWDNTLRGNIGAVIRNFPNSDDFLIESDAEPSVFWWSNPTNTFVDNVAAGSFGFGFWFDPKSHPDGPSATNTLNVGQVQAGEWGEFRGNVAHSTISADWEEVHKREINHHFGIPSTRAGGVGIMFGDNRRNPDDPTGTHIKQPDCRTDCSTYESTSYKNTLGMFFERENTLRPVDSTIAENWNGLFTDDNNREKDTVIFGTTDNIGNINSWGLGSVPLRSGYSSKYDDWNALSLQEGRSTNIVGAQESHGKESLWGLNWRYDGGNGKGITFINFQDSNQVNRGAIGAATNSHAIFMRESQLFDADAFIDDRNDHIGSVVRDLDGTLSGTGQYTEIRRAEDEHASNMLYDDTCELGSDGIEWAWCTGHSGKFKWVHSSITSTRFERLDTGDEFTTTHGSKARKYLPLDTTYRIHTNQELFPIEVTTMIVDKNNWWSLVFPLDAPLKAQDAGGNKHLFYQNSQITAVTSPSQYCSSTQKVTLYYDPSRGLQYLKIYGDSDFNADFEDHNSLFSSTGVKIDQKDNSVNYQSANEIVVC